MKLTNEGLRDTAAWQQAKVALPRYDREQMIRGFRFSKIHNPPVALRIGGSSSQLCSVFFVSSRSRVLLSKTRMIPMLSPESVCLITNFCGSESQSMSSTRS